MFAFQRFALLFGLICGCGRMNAESDMEWRKFDASVLADARAQNKLVFLDVEAVWCHWCHVMDAKTYSNPEVRAALKKDFIYAKLDQDSRPDLSKRYEEYGWPALVVLDPESLKERAIASGFQTPEEFLALLKQGRIQKNAGIHPVAPAAEKGSSRTTQKETLLEKLRSRYNLRVKGWGSGSKFVPWGNIEYCILSDREGDGAARKMAEDTLEAATQLIDPVWGGVYQYSTDDDWVHPHFEKIMEFQAEISRAYALAYLAWKRPADLKAAEDIARFSHNFLRSAEGAYYVSQDADVIQGEHSADFFKKSDSERRAIGIPRIDRHIYSRENGLAIGALVTLYQATSDKQYLDEAVTAAHWILANRSLDDGGFRHDETDSHGPFLADQVYMGRALVALHQATGEREWLNRAVKCGDFAIRKFQRENSEGAGFLTGIAFADAPLPVVDRDENIEAVRWLNLLGKTVQEERFVKAAEHGMRFLATDAVLADIYSFTGGILLADTECATEPTHIAVVGKLDDPKATALFEAAQKFPSGYKIVERISAGGGDTIFPTSENAAAYLCTGNRCSLPKFEADKLLESFQKR